MVVTSLKLKSHHADHPLVKPKPWIDDVQRGNSHSLSKGKGSRLLKADHHGPRQGSTFDNEDQFFQEKSEFPSSTSPCIFVDWRSGNLCCGKQTIKMGAQIKKDLKISVHQRRDNEGEAKRNHALKKAIAFAKFPLLANVVYFGWRWYNVLSNVRVSSGAESAAWIAFLLVEGTFAGRLGRRTVCNLRSFG